jgi:hypothetical protein
MANYLEINPSTTAQLVNAAGANFQKQAWGMSVALGSMQRSQFGAAVDQGVKSVKPIKQVLELRGLNGQIVNYQSRAPLGSSPGVQGSAGPRVSHGENFKQIMWQLQIGVHWQGAKYNLVAEAQTMLGVGDIDKQAQNDLKELFKLKQGWHMEAEMLANAVARTTIYANNKTSVEALRSADTFNPGMIDLIQSQMAGNMAAPVATSQQRGGGHEPVRAYYINCDSKMFADMKSNTDYRKELALSRVRGDDNELFYGDLPNYSGMVLDSYVSQIDTSDGPKGTLGAPVAFLGNALVALPLAGTFILGGGSAAAAAIVDPDPPEFFKLFPAAEFKQFETVKIAATTNVEYYVLIQSATTGKFGMYAYQVNNGNKLTLTKALRATNATSTDLDCTTVGSITVTTDMVETSGHGWSVGGVNYLQNTNAIGDRVYPCNSYGQPYVKGYALGDNAIWSAYGMFVDGSAMGMRTELKGGIINHNMSSEIGLAMNWGCSAVRDANNLCNGYCVIVGAYNPPGLPSLS